MIKSRKALFTSLFILVAVIVVISALQPISPWVFSPNLAQTTQNLYNTDAVDTETLLDSISKKPTFASTFSWWHTVWKPGVQNFWRPLSVQVFWLEKRFFSLDRFDLWMWVSFVVHILYSCLFGWFAYLIFGKRPVAAIVAILVYDAWRYPKLFDRLDLPGSAPSFCAMAFWKDQPELFVTTFVLGTLIALLNNRYWIALICAFLAVGFKETGWLSFILSLVILLFDGRYKRVPWKVYLGAFIAVAILLAFRLSAGRELFMSHSSGVHPFVRYFDAAGGVYGVTLMRFPFLSIIGTGIFATLFLRGRSKIASWICLAATIGLGLWLQGRMMDVPAIVAASMYFDPTQSHFPIRVIEIVLWLSGVALILKNADLRRQTMIVTACALVSVIPYASFTLTAPHDLHQPFAFQALFVTALFLAYWDRLKSNVPALRRLLSTEPPFQRLV